MSDFKVPPDLNEHLKDIKRRVQALAKTQAPQVYTLATRPPTTQVSGGVIIFVSDASSGSRFQGWDSTAGAWVPLG